MKHHYGCYETSLRMLLIPILDLDQTSGASGAAGGDGAAAAGAGAAPLPLPSMTALTLRVTQSIRSHSVRSEPHGGTLQAAIPV
jgi:hypothetical protein